MSIMAVSIPTRNSDSFNDLLEKGHWKLLFLAFLALVIVMCKMLQHITVVWLQKGDIGLYTALNSTLSKRFSYLPVATLAAIGVLQAAAGVAPIGDDIWHYTEVTDAFLLGSPYPVVTTSKMLQDAGMGATYPALPFFPLLLALSYSLVGRNLVGVALPTVVATALFPLVMYAACRAITGNTIVAYSTTILLFLFPIYQIHILGAPQPDTVFVVLLLLGALLAVKANSSPQKRYWLAFGAIMGCAALTRHEGIAYSAVLFLALLVANRRKLRLWMSVASFLAVLSPFIAYYHSISGSFWPSTFGSSIFGWHYLEANLTTLSWASLNWYAQAVGVERETVVAISAGIAASCVLGAVALGKQNLALAAIPLAGIGNLAAGFFMHPLVVYSPFPVEFLRHISFGIPFTIIGAAHTCYVGFRYLYRRIEGTAILRLLFIATSLVLVSGITFYESERMARPEWYFGGKASLLWTGSNYLLSDVIQHPVPLPLIDDHRSGEVIREAMTQPLDKFDLRKVNLSEPYHWASFLVAIFGLLFVSTSVLNTHPQHLPTKVRTALRTTCGPPTSRS